MQDGSLRLDNVSPEDEGKYVCHAENHQGKVNAASTLTVHCEYNIISINDLFIILNSKLYYYCFYIITLKHTKYEFNSILTFTVVKYKNITMVYTVNSAPDNIQFITIQLVSLSKFHVCGVKQKTLFEFS